jgi:chorismate synthase
VGGIFEVIAYGLPIGLGSHTQWDEKLDGRLCMAVGSIQLARRASVCFSPPPKSKGK